MRRLAPTLEIEIKLRIIEPDVVRRRLRQLGAKRVVPRTFESNTLFDTPRNALKRKGQLIRVRIQRTADRTAEVPVNGATQAIVTYKGPARGPISNKGKHNPRKPTGRFKIKEEAEVSVDNAHRMTRILSALGLRPVFHYEKFRTTYSLPGVPNVKVEVDETPIGSFLELEGTASAIDRAARTLGFSKRDYISKTYGALYIADCRRRGVKSTGLLFPPTKNRPRIALFP
jgi:adenylate cyclase class 2